MHKPLKKSQHPLYSTISGTLVDGRVIEPNLKQTFMYMEERKWNRKVSGKYHRAKPKWRNWMIIAYIAIVAFYIAARVYVFYKSNDGGDINWRELFIVGLIVIVMFFLTMRLYRFMYAQVMYCVVVLLIAGVTVIKDIFDIVVVAVIGAEAILFSLYMVLKYLLPYIYAHSKFCFTWMRTHNFSEEKLDRFIPVGKNEVQIGYIYRNRFKFLTCNFFRMCSTICRGTNEELGNFFWYRGGWKNGAPHGWGSWKDDSASGERLIGYWYNGVPIGPSRSTEIKTGNSFASVSILVCSCRRTDGIYCRTSREITSTIRYKVVTVECSISGGFYRNYPIVTSVPHAYQRVEFPPIRKGDFVPPLSLQEGDSAISLLMPKLRHLDKDKPLVSVTVSATAEGIFVSGHKGKEGLSSVTIQLKRPQHQESDTHLPRRLSENNLLFPESLRALPQLEIANWKENENYEALIFIHGYNLSAERAAKKFGQLIAAGNFPPNIIPVIFSWPTGRTLFYFNSLSNIHHPAITSSFGRLICSLHKANVTRIHVLTHSMGIRIFLHCLEHEHIRPLFYTRKHQPNVQQVRQEQYQEIIEQKEIAIEEEEAEVAKKSTPSVKILSAVFLNPDASLRHFRDHSYPILHSICSHITLYVDKTDGALAYQRMFSREASIGLMHQPLWSEGVNRGKLLDLDIVSVCDLQQNIHSIRHAAFNVNRSLLEDIREVLVNRKRAWSRDDKLLNREGNFYSFISIPPSVTADNIS